MRLHNVANAEEAVELAVALKRQGHYDWFRGQTKNWEVRSSLSRLDEEERAAALERTRRFYSWVMETPGLDELRQHPDSITAVGQHYGLRTDFIDFTTDPRIAGLFASGPTTHRAGDTACIVCLNTDDFNHFWDHYSNPEPKPRLLEPKVSNLWRLEAQAGVFLFCSYTDIEHHYSFDRILFPYSADFYTRNHVELFPGRQSQLEILLDQFFGAEQTLALHQAARDSPALLLYMPVYRFDPDVVRNRQLPPSTTWDPQELGPWLAVASEPLGTERSGPSVPFEVDLARSPTENAKAFAQKVRVRFSRSRKVRDQRLLWPILDTGNQLVQSSKVLLGSALERLWDGTRKLPYTDDQVVAALGRCVELLDHRLRIDHDSADPWLEAARRCFGESIMVEFGGADGSGSRGYCSVESLKQAVRPDIEQYLNPSWAQLARRDVTQLLLSIPTPDHLFSFDMFTDVFVREILPSQVLRREGSKGVIYYSPARLIFFGLP